MHSKQERNYSVGNNLALNVPSLKVTLYARHVLSALRNNNAITKRHAMRRSRRTVLFFRRHARSSYGDIISSFPRYDILLMLQTLCAYFSRLSFIVK